MKQYSNSPRKPMMYGGDSRMKRMSGSPPAGEAPVARQKMTEKKEMEIRAGGKELTDAQVQAQVREEMMRKKVPELQAIAGDKGESAMRREMAKSALREKGDKGAMPQGDQQPAGMMYGGKSMKKKK